MRHGGRITAKRSGRIKKISFFYPVGVLPARFERILALFPILIEGFSFYSHTRAIDSC